MMKFLTYLGLYVASAGGIALASLICELWVCTMDDTELNGWGMFIIACMLAGGIVCFIAKNAGLIA